MFESARSIAVPVSESVRQETVSVFIQCFHLVFGNLQYVIGKTNRETKQTSVGSGKENKARGIVQ